MADNRVFSCLRTNDLHAARNFLKCFIGDHHVRVMVPLEWLDMELDVVRCLTITCAALAYGCPLKLEFPQPRSDYLIIKVGTGECCIERDDERICLKAGGLLVVSPTESLVLRSNAQCRFRVIKIDRLLMHQKFASLTGSLPAGPIRFRPIGNTALPAGDVWTQRFEHLLMWLEDDTRRLPRGHLRAIEDAFVEQLLRHPCHENVHRIRRNRPAYTLDVSPRAIEAVEFAAVHIRTDLLREISTAEYARWVGISPCELARAFLWLWRCRLRDYRRDMRLDCVRADLLRAEPGPGIIEKIARSWRLLANARFYRGYWKRFGEWPEDTLRRLPE